MWPTKVFCGVVIVCMSLSSGWAYEFNMLGRVGGWDRINRSDTVTTVLDVSDYTIDIPSGNVDTALKDAYNSWDSVTTAPNLNFFYETDHGKNYDAFDGPNDSAGPPWFDGTSPTLDQNANWNYANIVLGGWLPWEYFENLDPGYGDQILAVTWTGRLRGGLGPRKPTWHAEIFFNDEFEWTDNPLSAVYSPGDPIDIETVALHELGHTIGLGHEDDVPSVMGTYYEGVQRDLFPDDEAGVTALYGRRGRRPGSLTMDGAEWHLTGVTYVPEPSSFMLAAMALLGLLGYGWWKRRTA